MSPKEGKTIEPINASFDKVTESLVKTAALPIPANQPIALPFIMREEEGETIYQRIADGYVNATAMCKAANKRFNDYTTGFYNQAFINELSSDTGIPATELIQQVKGGEPSKQGTWVHPQVAIHLAQWLSPKFAVKVSQWVVEWMTGNAPQAAIPYHLRRYMENIKRVPAEYFSVLQEMTLVLIAPLEQMGYTLPKNMVPDISQGKIFAGWLREQGVNTDNMPKYIHKYEDGREVEAKLYPAKYLSAFREHVARVWMPKHAQRYFSERDKTALPHIEKVLQLNAPPETKLIEVQ